MFWQELGIGLLSSVLAEIFFWLGLGALVIFFYLRPAQKRFERFFGLENDRGIDICLSNLWDPEVEKQPWGEIVAGQELEAAKKICNLFASTSPSFPELVQGLVDRIWFRGKYNASIKVSPETCEHDLSKNMIVIGATTKNSVRRHLLANSSYGVLVRIKGEAEVPPTNIHENPLEPTFIIRRRTGPQDYNVSENLKLAVIERLVVGGSGNGGDGGDRVVLMCAGTTGKESKAAVEYLADEWRDLEKDHKGRKHFAWCFIFDDECLSQPPLPIFEPD